MAALLFVLTAVAGCGGSLEENKRGPENTPAPGGPIVPPEPEETPTPVAPLPGQGEVAFDRLTTGVFGFSQSAGQYEVSVQVSDASLGLGNVESEGGTYTLEPQYVGVRKVGK